MSESLRCPDCGAENPSGAERCASCNFPLHGIPAAAPPAPVAPPAASAEPAGEAPIVIRRPLPRAARQARSAANSQALSLWLFVGGFCVLILLWIAIKANMDRASQPVEGSTEAQQKLANELQAELAKDSTNVRAHIALGDILYDTANWQDAIVHYRTAVRLDSSQVTAIVDQGVCYYNLSDVETAERLFRLALSKDPHQPVALFNLGILSERREELDQAMRYYHAAMQSDPPEAMREPLMKALERVAGKSGAKPGPLPDVR